VLIALVFSYICAPAEGKTSIARLKYLLNRYCERAIENAHLIQSMLVDSSLIGEELSRFTDQIRQELEAFVDVETVTPVLNLIIDYTNRLLRQYLPLGADLIVHSQAKLSAISR